MKYFLLILFISIFYTTSEGSISENFNLVIDAATNIVHNTVPRKLTTSLKNLIAGKPFNVAFATINQMCMRPIKYENKIYGISDEYLCIQHPCFDHGETLTSLSRGDAEFVDVIHSNSGGLGKRDPIGDSDWYSNGVQPLPPGCMSIICAHQRAMDFYAETVYPGNENNFLAGKCHSLDAFRQGLCPRERFPMGYAAPHNLKGNFFLTTNNKSPFGKNATGNVPVCRN